MKRICCGFMEILKRIRVPTGDIIVVKGEMGV